MIISLPFINIQDFLIESIIEFNVEGIKTAIDGGADIYGVCLEFRKYYTPSWKPHIWFTNFTGKVEPYADRNFIFTIAGYTKEQRENTYRVIDYLRSVGAKCSVYDCGHETNM